MLSSLQRARSRIYVVPRASFIVLSEIHAWYGHCSLANSVKGQASELSTWGRALSCCLTPCRLASLTGYQVLSVWERGAAGSDERIPFQLIQHSKSWLPKTAMKKKKKRREREREEERREKRREEEEERRERKSDRRKEREITTTNRKTSN